MVSDFLALVGADSQMTCAVQSTVERQLGHRLSLISQDAIRQGLWTRSRGMLILAVESATDLERSVRLARELALQDLAIQVVLLAGEDIPGDSITGPKALGLRQLRWPSDTAALMALIRPRLSRGSRPDEPGVETVQDRIARALLNFTPSLRQLVEPLALAAAHDVPVLISGETGTGKTHLARLMHDCSPRQAHRFLVVSCGTLSPQLIESELFGHVKGAFTGAEHTKEGKFAAAGQGTILLDEIDALALEQQANLLRVIETGEFEPVGSNETRLCQARIIAAGNRDLAAAVESGKFRRDLYYRLHVMAFHLPPLRERRIDIGPLTRGIAAHYNTKFRKDLVDIAPETFAALEWFPWPGNIRQLENVVQQAVLVSTGPTLVPAFLPQPIQRAGCTSAKREAGPNWLLHNRHDVERNLIERALRDCDNSRTVAAKNLGISRVTLYKKMRKYGLLGPSARAATEPVAAGQ